MKRLTFKKPFNGMDSALKLIPESYKVDGKEFQITDGTETYNIRWDINEATVLIAENKNLINEDMNKIKHLMGFKSQDTLGTLKGEERLNENKSFTDVWNKTKDISESGQAFGMGFSNEGNLEENEPMKEMERVEEEVDEGSLASKVAALGDEPTPKNEGVYEEALREEEVESTTVSVSDIRKKAKDLIYSLNTKKFSGQERKVTNGLLDMINQLGGEENSYSPRLVKFLTLAQQALDDKSEPEAEDATPDLAQDTMSANQNEEKDRFDEIFEDMYKEELTDKQSEVMDTDGDGDIDAKDLANLRNKK